MDRKDALIQKQKEYIEFLGKHVSEGAVFMHIHNCPTPQEEVDKGIKFREEIAALESSSAVPDEVRGEVPEWFEKWAWEEVGRTKLTGRSDKAIFVNAAIAAYKKLSGSLGGVGGISLKERFRCAWQASREVAPDASFDKWWKFFEDSNMLSGDLPAPPSDPK